MPAPPSPFDDPVPRGYRVVLATLRIAVALQCWGAAAAWLVLREDFGLLPLLMRHAGLSTAALTSLLDKISWGLGVCGLLTLVRPCWPVLLPVTAWFTAIAAIGPLAGEPFRPATHAVRCAAPLALLLLDFWPPAVKFALGRAMAALIVMRLGIATTFAAQGCLALSQSRTGGPLTTQLAAAIANIVPSSPAAGHAPAALGIVGGIYLGLAVGLLLVRSRAIALLMTVLGGLAAMSYVIAGGPEQWGQTLLHAAGAGAPAALFVYWWRAVREQPAITVPA
jgi:hypothetical protein